MLLLYAFFATLLSHMYLISRSCDADHSISLKFIEGHSTSYIKRAFRPQLYIPMQYSIASYSFLKEEGDCLYFKGEGGKLGNLSGAMSCVQLLAVFVCILLMTLLAGY